MRWLRAAIPIFILLLATALRVYRPGLWMTWGDELNIINAAVGITQRGEWTWLGNEASFGALAAHSPFSVYVTAIPALISPHPLFLRLVYAMLGVLTVAVMYRLLRKHVGFTTAVMGALFIAVMPITVHWSRFVWNPNLAPLLLVIWIYAAADGYNNKRRWGQYAHWFALDFAIQAQTALVALVPLSLILTLYAFVQNKNSRKSFLWHHALIAVIITVTLLPWVYGLYGYQQGWWTPPLGVGDFDAGNLELRLPTVKTVVENFSLLTANTHYWQGNFDIYPDALRWWFPDWAYPLLYGQALLASMATVMLIVRGLRRKDFARFGLFLAAATLFPLCLLVVNRTISDFYMMATVFAGIAGLAWAVQIISERYRWIIIVPLVFAGLQLWLTVSMIDWNRSNPILLRYGDVIELVDTWHADSHELLFYEYNPNLSALEQHKWQTHWHILSASYPIRISTDLTAIPLASHSQRLITSIEDSWLVDLWGEGQVYETLERDFVVFDVSIDQLPQANFVTQVAEFGDLASIIGLYAPLLQSGDNPVYLYWQPQQATGDTYQFSLRLVDEVGTIHAQTDQTSMQPQLWRVGDTVVSFINLNIVDTIPADGHFELVMYRLADGSNVPVAGGDGVIMRLEAVQPDA
jgi:hypothetical protein